MEISAASIIHFVITFFFIVFFSRKVDAAFPELSEEKRSIIWWVVFFLYLIALGS
jgi:hypothetical protein